MLYSTWLIYLVEVYGATSLRQNFSSANHLFQHQDRKNNSANIFREYKKKKQMHSVDSVVAFSTQRFSFCCCCDLTDSLKIGVVIDKEYPFYLLIKNTPFTSSPLFRPLHPYVHLYMHTCRPNVRTHLGQGSAELQSLLCLICTFGRALHYWALGYFLILTLFFVEILSLRLKILEYAEQKVFEYLDQHLTLSYPCCISTQ